MPSTSAICRSASADTWPCSCWTMARQAITADWRWSAGYFATSRAKRARVAAEGVASVALMGYLPVNLAEHDVHRADHRNRVRNQVAARNLVPRGEVGEALRPVTDACGVIGDV